jgi:glycosyltransferase involved in cell wall biosynthesis
MKIAIVTDVYAELTGIGRFIDMLTKGLEKRNEIQLYTAEDFRYISMPYGYKIAFPHGKPEGDVVHVQTPYVMGRWGRKSGLPCVMTTHTFPEHLGPFSKFGPMRHELTRFFSSADRLTCQTQEVYEHLAEEGMRKPDYIIPNPFDLSYAKGADKKLFEDTYGISEPYSLATFRLSSEKAPRDIVEIAKLMPEYNFVLGGEGPQLPWIQKNAPKNLKLVGRMSQALLKSAYSSCAFLIHPALVEMFGYSVIEAMSFGKPVIVRDIPGFKFLGDSVLRYKTYDDLRDRVKSLMESKSLILKSGKKALLKVEEFDYNKIGARFEKVYKELCR